MVLFLPRARRIAAELDVAILLVEHDGQRPVAGPAAGVLRNISRSGCCVEMESPLVDGHHFFFSTLNSLTLYLLLEGEVPALEPLAFQVAARSVWMKGADEERPPGFRLGLQFFERQARLFQAVRNL